MWGELALSLQHMNGYVTAIISLGFLATLVFFERLLMLQFVYHIDFSKFLNNLKKMVAAEDLDRAITLCKNVSQTSLPRISLKALEAADTDPTKVRGTIEEETIDFLPNIERRLGVLPAITLLIMLVGVLGTIDSLWLAFHSIDVLDTAKKQATLAQGIASALNPTALGLMFGMVFLSGNYILKGMAVNLIERVHYGVAVLTNLLVPADVATYVPMTAPAGGGDSAPNFDKSSEEFSGAKEEPSATPSDESFDDVSVEDIKDEEEII